MTDNDFFRSLEATHESNKDNPLAAEYLTRKSDTLLPKDNEGLPGSTSKSAELPSPGVVADGALEPADTGKPVGRAIDTNQMVSRLAERDRLINRFEGQLAPKSSDAHQSISVYNQHRDAGKWPPHWVYEELKLMGVDKLQNEIYEMGKNKPAVRELERLTNERNFLAHSSLYDNARPWVVHDLQKIDQTTDQKERQRLTAKFEHSPAPWPLPVRDQKIVDQIIEAQRKINKVIESNQAPTRGSRGSGKRP